MILHVAKQMSGTALCFLLVFNDSHRKACREWTKNTTLCCNINNIFCFLTDPNTAITFLEKTKEKVASRSLVIEFTIWVMVLKSLFVVLLNQVKANDEAVSLCKTSIGSLKLDINDLPATKVIYLHIFLFSGCGHIYHCIENFSESNPVVSVGFYMIWNLSKYKMLPKFAVAPHCRTKIQGAGLDPHPGGGDW